MIILGVMFGVVVSLMPLLYVGRLVLQMIMLSWTVRADCEVSCTATVVCNVVVIDVRDVMCV